MGWQPGRAVVRGLGLLLLVVVLAAGAWLSMSGRPGRINELPRTDCGVSGPEMRWVPGGRVTLGDDVYPEEQPLREVDVAGFWMDRTEVSNDQFAAFVQATGYVTEAERRLDPARHPGVPAEMLEPGAVVFVPPRAVSGLDPTQWWRFVRGASWRHPGGPGTDIAGRGAYPVVAVTLADAQAYAAWKGRALPTEAEWEWAARAAVATPRAHDTTAGQRVPEQPGQANTWQGLFPVHDSGDDGFVGLAPVGCYAANALGLHDLIGNVWEHTADAWATGAAQHVIKGGSFLCAPNYCRRYRAAARQPQDSSLAASHLGFRTVARTPGPPR